MIKGKYPVEAHEYYGCPWCGHGSSEAITRAWFRETGERVFHLQGPDMLLSIVEGCWRIPETVELTQLIVRAPCTDGRADHLVYDWRFVEAS